MSELLDPAIDRPKPIIELFLRIGPDELAEIRDAADVDTLQQAAHKLKGTASMLGLRALEHACRELDAIARQGDFEGGRARVAGLVREFDATCDALRAELR